VGIVGRACPQRFWVSCPFWKRSRKHRDRSALPSPRTYAQMPELQPGQTGLRALRWDRMSGNFTRTIRATLTVFA
jgi:hypothetical protein